MARPVLKDMCEATGSPEMLVGRQRWRKWAVHSARCASSAAERGGILLACLPQTLLLHRRHFGNRGLSVRRVKLNAMEYRK